MEQYVTSRTNKFCWDASGQDIIGSGLVKCIFYSQPPWLWLRYRSLELGFSSYLHQHEILQWWHSHISSDLRRGRNRYSIAKNEIQFSKPRANDNLARSIHYGDMQELCVAAHKWSSSLCSLDTVQWQPNDKLCNFSWKNFAFPLTFYWLS